MGALRIIAYHRVGLPRTGDAERMTVTPERFKAHMALLRHTHLTPLSMDAVPHFLAKGMLPPRYYALTFDDGFADIFDHAFPVLVKYTIPAVVFVVANRQRADWTDWGPLGPHRLLSWPQIELMAEAGVTIGCHTASHVNLLECNARRLDEEVRGAKRRIEDRIGHPVRHFCYPYGQLNREVLEAVQRAGYTSACTTERGFVQETSNPFALPRLSVGRRMGVLHFARRTLLG